MAEYLEFTLDKFFFKVATDRLYTPEGVWAAEKGDRVTLGMSDYLQQRSGDIAFAEIAVVGTLLSMGEPFADIETIKADIELLSPVSGAVLEVNPKLDFEAEIINQDPFGAGWLAIVEAANWTADSVNLLSPEEYLAAMKIEALKEIEEL